MKTLNKEIELLKAARESAGHEFEQAEMTQKELEKELRQKDWELDDVKAMSHARSVGGAENVGVENAGVENTGAKTYGEPSKQKINFIIRPIC